MDFKHLSGEELIAQLKTAGRSPSSDLLQAIIDNKKSHPDLINRLRKVCLNENLSALPVDTPERLEGVILGRLAIHLGLKNALPILGELYRNTWGDDVTVDGLGREMAHFGPDAIPIFQSLIALNTLGKWHSGKSVAITILSDIALMFPKMAAQVKQALRSGLPPLNSNGGISAPKDEMWSEIGIALGKLQDESSHKKILAMIRQGVTDNSVISRDRYDQFYSGKKSPRKPEPFDIFKKYQAMDSFEAMLGSIGDGPIPVGPDHSQDLVARAKRIDAKQKGPKINVGRNDPCICGSGKKYKNCCGKK